jgi:hypothetical protein
MVRHHVRLPCFFVVALLQTIKKSTDNHVTGAIECDNLLTWKGCVIRKIKENGGGCGGACTCACMCVYVILISSA